MLNQIIRKRLLRFLRNVLATTEANKFTNPNLPIQIHQSKEQRMKNSLVGLLLIVALSFSTAVDAKSIPSVKAEKQGMSSERLERIKEITQQYVDDGKLAGVITMVARRGEIVHFEAVGQRGVNDDTPLKKDDLFRIYSMTKPVTATALMQLYEQGKFHLSDPVSKFVPELKDLQVLNAEG